MTVTVITTTEDLTALCQRLASAEFITVDTEFMRETTFWPKLCLAQVAGPDEAAAIDTMASGLDLAPLFELLSNPSVLKVFHAARQDLEIFHHLDGRVPGPLFDSQVAAMVCGFGEQVSYQALAAKLAGAHLDKSSRFTDWSHRPLSERQLEYAIGDVTHLRVIYQRLSDSLEKSGRATWVAEEMTALSDPALYEQLPVNAWKRIKSRSTDGRFLAVLSQVAAWREKEAQARDQPRNRILRDESLLEIAARAPTSVDGLARTRGLGKRLAEGSMGKSLIAAVTAGLAMPEADRPKAPKARPSARGAGPVIELLKVLLKKKCEAHDVAQRLVANSAELERIAAENDADVPALNGWRREIFGEDALALKSGKLALSIKGGQVHVDRLDAIMEADE
ncbi:MAG: ribonuclease D [Alphaproteobacteria bacterium]|jgi:ribonuclease D